MGGSEPLIRHYVPETDYLAVQTNLLEAQLYDPDRDTDAMLARYASTVLVAEVEGEVVGSVYASEGIMPIVWRLAVRETHRRRGIGSLLLEAAAQQLATQGHPDFELFVDSEDLDVQAWYTKRDLHPGGEYVSLWRPTRSNTD